MRWRLLAIAAAFGAVMLFSTGSAMAGRLGGAYRGPYKDNLQTRNTNSTEPVPAAKQDSGSKSSSSQSGSDSKGSGGGTASPGSDNSGGGSSSSGGTTTSGGGAASPPSSGSGDSGGGSSSDSGGPQTTTGGSGSGSSSGSSGGSTSGSSSSSSSSSGGLGLSSSGSGRSSGGGRGGKTNVDDVQAFWPFWFEHNKEWMLARILKKRAATATIPTDSSVANFSGDSIKVSITPVSQTQKQKVIYPVLLNALKSRGSWVRDAAVLALGKLGTEAAVPHIALELKDADGEIRQDALLALGLTRQVSALKPLMDAFQRATGQEQACAALGLGLLGHTEVIPQMLRVFNRLIRRRQNDPTASCVAVALGMLGDKSVVEDLSKVFRVRGREDLKSYVCQALGRIGGKSAERILVSVFRSRERGASAAAALALANFPERGVIDELTGRGLRSGDRMTKLYSTISLGLIARGMRSGDRMRLRIGYALKDLAEKPQQDKYAAMYASLALAVMKDDAANKYFQKYLKPENRKFSQEVHSAMAMAVGMLGDETAAHELETVVQRSANVDNYRGYAAFSLGVMGNEKSSQVIVDAMQRQSAHRGLLRSSCWALGLLGDKQSLPILIKQLKLSDPSKHDVRGAAAIAIGMIGDASAVDPLVKIVKKDSDETNQAFAIAALGCLVDPSPVPRIPQMFRDVNYREQVPIVREVMTDL